MKTPIRQLNLEKIRVEEIVLPGNTLAMCLRRRSE